MSLRPLPKKRRKHPWREILADYLAGMSGGELHKKYGCPRPYGAILAMQHKVKRTAEVAARAALKCGTPRRAELSAVLSMVEAGGYKAAAEKFGYSVNHVRSMARRNKIKPPNTRLDKAGILAAYDAGESLAEIAAQFGCSLSYPSKLMRRRQVQRRTI